MNSSSFSRRWVLRAIPALLCGIPELALGAPEVSSDGQFAAIERGIGGRLGVAAIDTGSGRRLIYRAQELFAMCSTFKLLLAAGILKNVDDGSSELNKPIRYTEKDLLEYAPVTRAHVQQGAMTVSELCAAAIEFSDNTAANLLLAQLGGPAGLTQFIRSLGNRVTRLDRIEPDLNSALPGDPRDTTSPMAMAESAAMLLTGTSLSVTSRNRLAGWLEKSVTGANRLRAGFPAAWRAGDKTGTGEHGAIGDVGIFWPPSEPPIVIAAYIMEGNATGAEREEAIAAAGRVTAKAMVATTPIS
jgi:beta-lactamase class A